MTERKKKLIRVAAVPESLNLLLKGQLLFMSQYFDVVAVSSSGELLEELVKRENVKTKSIKIARRISPVRDFLALWELYFFFKKEKPEIVHSITPKAGLLSMIAAKLAGVPVRMHTFTGLIFPYQTGLFRTVLIFMDKLLCHCATNVYPEGQGVKNDLINYKITNKQLDIIANGNVNGIDIDYFHANSVGITKTSEIRNQLGILEEDFIFIFVGRLVPDKGINELIAAFKEIKNKNIKLLLVGFFEEQLDQLEKETIDEIKVNSRILSVGFQKDVRSYFSIADALVFPSHREGFPNVVLQAGAMDLPSIVTDISGSNEIIVHQVNGIVIPPKNVAHLKSAMELLVTDLNMYNHLKKNARGRIVTLYDKKQVWEAQLNEYHNLLEK